MFKQLFNCIFILTIIGCNNENKNQKKLLNADIETSKIIADSLYQSSPLLEKRNAIIEASLQLKTPIILLKNLGNNEKIAQDLAITNEKFTENLFNQTSGEPFRNEIFNVYEARPQEITQGSASKKIYKVELYNFALNLSTSAFVDIIEKKVFGVTSIQNTQPEIPQHLKQLALDIATANPEVIKALGYTPENKDALMANTKTALNNTYCERSQHLCVAPTFIKGDKALWAIVDLTDQKLVGIRWTNTGISQAARVSERRLKFDKIMECYCKQVNTIEKGNWKYNYVITNSDGLRISEVFYKNKLVINNAKVVDWHVSYSNTDGFGYSDAVGCPEFSQAAVVAVSEPRLEPINENGKLVGYALNQNFSSQQWPKPCNYNYLQRYEFYLDGRFRPIAASLGRGCGNNGTYRPVTRISFAGNNSVSEWTNNNWGKWLIEKWSLQKSNTEYTQEGYQYKISNENGSGFYLLANTGLFKDGGRGDNAFLYATKFHVDKNEGEADLISIGPCCNTDYRQGPEKFIEPKAESLEKSNSIVWYVPQMKNDNTKGKEYCWAETYMKNGIFKTKVFPGYSGPMFIPITK
jgi:hypothetical protein